MRAARMVGDRFQGIGLTTGFRLKGIGDRKEEAKSTTTPSAVRGEKIARAALRFLPAFLGRSRVLATRRVSHIGALTRDAVVAALVFCLLAGAPIFAQTETATLSGIIQDPKGGVVPDVEVTITRIETGTSATTKTNGAGIYVLTGLQPGHFHMSIRKPGFKEIAIKVFELHVQDKLEQNFSLEIGSVSETVTVTGTNGMWATTDSPAVGTLVTRDFVQNMPLNGRSFEDLILLTPGTVSSAASGNVGFSTNGQRYDANYYMVDGVSANIYAGSNTAFASQYLSGTLPAQTTLGTTQALLSVDAMEEFRIQTSGSAAEYGRQPGGAIQLTTRSGSNEWHGTAFDYFRNTVFDANSWFANAHGVSRQAEHQNDFGGTLGGPLDIPGLYRGKNRTFFFFSYEGLRLLLPNFVQDFAPTTAFRQNAAAGVQPFLNAFPIPNGLDTGDGVTAQFSAGYSDPSNLDAVSLRVDHHWGDKLHVFGRYGNTPSTTLGRSAPASNAFVATTNTRTVTVGAAVLISQHLLNDLHFNYSRSDTKSGWFLDSFGGGVPYAQTLLVPPQYVQGGSAVGDFTLCIDGSPLCGGPRLENHITQQHQYNLTDGLSLTTGKHGLKFGIDYRRLLPVFNQASYSAILQFSSVSGVQQGIADFDLVQAAKSVHPTFTNFSFYAQDHWKLAPRITVEYGLRWELNPVPGESNGLDPLAVTQVSDLSNIQLAPQGTPPYRTQYHNFAPRLGIAWAAVNSQHHPVVVRGAFGIYYDTGQAQWALAYRSSALPFGNFSFIQNVSVPIQADAVPPPPLDLSLAPPYSGLGLMDPNLRLPYTEQYNLSVDIGLATKNTITISYVGNQGHRLLETLSHSDIPNFESTTITDNSGFSSYNSLQIQDRGYVAPGLQLIASYTFAHAIDNVSVDFSQGLAPVRGNSDNDIRHVFSTALNYAIPGAGSTGFVRALTHGWLFANRFTAQSGYPFNVTQGTYVNQGTNQSFNIYPDLVPGVNIYLHDVASVPGGWQLNPAAFSLAPLNSDGSPAHASNVPRNFFQGPGFWTLNTAFERTFPIRERLHLIFRAEAFNIFNHPNFGGINNFFCGEGCNPTFGQALGTTTIGVANQLYASGAPRSWQFMLKLQF